LDEHGKLIALASEYLASAQDSLRAHRANAAFESARHAAELAGKAMLLQAIGEYPKRHDIGGALHAAGLVPSEVDPVRLDKLLALYLRGHYEWNEASETEAHEALHMAERLIAAASAQR
jgi:HEPN domain-containing protein